MDAAHYAGDAWTDVRTHKTSPKEKQDCKPAVNLKDLYYDLEKDVTTTNSSEKSKLMKEIKDTTKISLKERKCVEALGPNLHKKTSNPILMHQRNLEDSVDSTASYISRRFHVGTHDESDGVPVGESVQSGVVYDPVLTMPAPDLVEMGTSAPINIPIMKRETTDTMTMFQDMYEDMAVPRYLPSDEEYNLKEDSPVTSDSDSDYTFSEELLTSKFGDEVKKYDKICQKKILELKQENKFLKKRIDSSNDCLKFFGKM